MMIKLAPAASLASAEGAPHTGLSHGRVLALTLNLAARRGQLTTQLETRKMYQVHPHPLIPKHLA